MRTTATLSAFLVAFLILHPHTTAAQPAADTSVCEYQGTWENPETFQGPSITKEEIQECLRANMNAAQEERIPIKNHHIVFEDYRDAWKELAEETGDYTIPLLIDGGILRAKNGEIRLGEFSDPTATDTLVLTDEQRNTFKFERWKARASFIRAKITWERVFVDSKFTIYGKYILPSLYIIVNKEVSFIESKFNNKVSFEKLMFRSGVYFNKAEFGNLILFNGVIFNGGIYFRRALFSSHSIFKNIIFNRIVYFYQSYFSDEVSFRKVLFNEMSFYQVSFKNDVLFDQSVFVENVIFTEIAFDLHSSFTETIFKKTASFRGSRFYVSSFTGSKFEDNVDFRNIRASKIIFNNTTWKGRVDLRQIVVEKFQWDSTESPSNIKGAFDLREAQIDMATFKGIHFHNLADFSRATFGTILFARGTFEKIADFRHITSIDSVVFIDNRFLNVFDLTGVTFNKHNSTPYTFFLLNGDMELNRY